MEFRLDEAQIELQETISRFCDDRFPLDRVGAREREPLDRSAWRGMAELGVFSLMADERDGGAALGPVECAIVFEQLGSHLVSGPVLWSVLASTVVPDASRGELVVTGVDGSAVSDGTAVVEHGSDADAVLVLSTDRVELHRIASPAAAQRLDPLDPLTPVSRVSGLIDGEVVGDADDAHRIRDMGHVLVAAMQSGIASRSLETARSYAVEREQFDVAIGSFQAVKHMLADMYVRSGLAQCASYAAAAVLDNSGDDRPGGTASSAAVVVATDAAISNASTAVQILGGMGFTWDMLPNYLLKRAWVLEHTLDPSATHAEHVGAALVGAAR